MHGKGKDDKSTLVRLLSKLYVLCDKFALCYSFLIKKQIWIELFLEPPYIPNNS